MNDYKIYPKQFHNAKIPIVKDQIFWLMPFNDEFDMLYGQLKKDLQKSNFICKRVDEIAGSIPIINKIITEILRSRYIIVDLTTGNPNVFYELGIAHSFKDAQNIILLKQKDTPTPFDITHLTYTEYEIDNLKLLSAQIRKYIESNQYITEFHEILNSKAIISMVSETTNLFVDYITNHFGVDLKEITDILNGRISSFSDSKIEEILSNYEKLILHSITLKDEAIISKLFIVYFHLLEASSGFSSSEKYSKSFLSDSSIYSRNHYNSSDLLMHQTELALILANEKKLLNISIPWIITYFSKSKTASIDLNRYRVEAFLMTTTHEDIDEAVSNALFDQDCHIREHCADIIGEKKIYMAEKNLCTQLQKEENYFTVVSIISAMGKLLNPAFIDYITEWIDKNSDNIIRTEQFFVLKHARVALEKLPKHPSNSCISDFDKKFSDFLKDYFIL